MHHVYKHTLTVVNLGLLAVITLEVKAITRSSRGEAQCVVSQERQERLRL